MFPLAVFPTVFATLPPSANPPAAPAAAPLNIPAGPSPIAPIPAPISIPAPANTPFAEALAAFAASFFAIPFPPPANLYLLEAACPKAEFLIALATCPAFV